MRNDPFSRFPTSRTGARFSEWYIYAILSVHFWSTINQFVTEYRPVFVLFLNGESYLFIFIFNNTLNTFFGYWIYRMLGRFLWI